jgi:hypothetical protein
MKGTRTSCVTNLYTHFVPKTTINVMRQECSSECGGQVEDGNNTILDDVQAAAHKNAPPRTPAQEKNRKRYENTRCKQLTSYCFPKCPWKDMQNYVHMAATVKNVNHVRLLQHVDWDAVQRELGCAASGAKARLARVGPMLDAKGPAFGLPEMAGNVYDRPVVEREPQLNFDRR